MRIRRFDVVLLCSSLLVMSLGTQTLFACYAIVAGKNATADGSVLVGHAEQNPVGKIFLNFLVVPRIRHACGDMVVLKNGIRYPQPDESYRYLWSENFGLAGSDAVMNEWGVICVNNGTHTKKQSMAELRKNGELVETGIICLLGNEVAKRARTAKEGIDIITGLIAKFGFGAAGVSYVIADPNEAWILSTSMGKQWVAQRVGDDEVALLPNVNIIQEIDLRDTSRFRASPDLISYAEKKGWYDPKNGKPFNFKAAYDDPFSIPWFTPQNHCDPRQWRGQSFVTGQELPLPAVGALPFSVKPNRRLTVKDLREFLSDHLEGTPFDPTKGYTLGSPHDALDHVAGVICHNDSQEISIFQLRSSLPREIGCVYWRTTGPACSSVLTPWYAGILETPDAYHKQYDLKQNLTETFHLDPPAATYEYDASKAFWVFHDFCNWVDRDYARNIKKVQPVWREFERDEFRMQEAVEATAGKLYGTDKELAQRFLTDYCAGRALQAMAKARRMSEGVRAKSQDRR